MKKRGRETTRVRSRKAPTSARHRNLTAADLQKQLNQRTGELAQAQKHLAEALEQQTATAEVLRAISSSSGELEPVFQAMLANAVRICEASYGVLFRFENGAWRAAAMHGVPPEFAEFWQRGPQRPGPRTALGRIAQKKETVHIADVTTDPAYVEGEPVFVAAAKLGKFRTFLAVPMLKENELIGAFGIYRKEVRPFTDKQIELVTNFAAQAVIAIENTRLLNELRDSLQQQTATAEVLRVISSSPGELEPVFQTILASAIRICEAKFGVLLLCDEGGFRTVAIHNAPPAFVEERRRNPLIHPPQGTGLRLLAETKQVAQVADMKALKLYIDGDPFVVNSVDLGGYRTVVNVPMLKEGALIGAISIYRQEVRPFTDKQIELVQNFADQAVIAIENTRLLNELRESLQQQTATSEVLQVISSSPGELEPVFQAMLANATSICEAKFGTLYLREQDALRMVAAHNVPPAFLEARRTTGPFRPHAGGNLGEVMSTKQPVQVADLATTRAYIERHPATVAAVEVGAVRTTIAVPMLKGNELTGVISIFRQEVRPFSDKQVTLLTNFASQAVIAIENARLLNELRESLQQQTATADVLRVISGSRLELQPIFETVLENAVRLCDAERSFIFLFDGKVLRAAASHNTSPELREFIERNPITPGRHSAAGRAALERRTVHIPDVQADPEYTWGVGQVEPLRTLLGVPMLKGHDLVGVIITQKDRSPISRSRSWRVLPPKRSSPSRTRACSTNCVSRYSNKPPPPTCSRSSAARRLTCSPSSTHWLRTSSGYARPRGRSFSVSTENFCARRRAITCHLS